MTEAKCSECSKDITKEVSDYSKNHYSKELCMDCQKVEKNDKDVPAEKVEDEILDTPTNRNEKWEINPKFIINISGKDFITANGLLEIAEKQAGGIHSIEVVKLSPITSDGFMGAIAHVRVTMKDGRVFEDYGSATKENLKPAMQKYAVEMAVTRGRSRCIRFGLNVDYCSFEELSQ